MPSVKTPTPARKTVRFLRKPLSANSTTFKFKKGGVPVQINFQLITAAQQAKMRNPAYTYFSID